MKLCLSVFLVVLVATLLLFIEYTIANNICPKENCLESMKCSDWVVGATCPQSNHTCCSVVKSKHRTHCRHFGGECMDFCSELLRQPAVDCPADKVCCTLV